jgi:hypothetical protein
VVFVTHPPYPGEAVASFHSIRCSHLCVFSLPSFKCLALLVLFLCRKSSAPSFILMLCVMFYPCRASNLISTSESSCSRRAQSQVYCILFYFCYASCPASLRASEHYMRIRSSNSRSGRLSFGCSTAGMSYSSAVWRIGRRAYT